MTADLLTLSQAAKQLPRVNGKRIHVSTLWRWCRRGLKGTRLEYSRVGRTIMVSDEALNRFFTSLAEADFAQSTQADFKPNRNKRRPRPAQRQAARDEAETILRNAKILV